MTFDRIAPLGSKADQARKEAIARAVDATLSFLPTDKKTQAVFHQNVWTRWMARFHKVPWSGKARLAVDPMFQAIATSLGSKGWFLSIRDDSGDVWANHLDAGATGPVMRVNFENQLAFLAPV